MQTRVINLLKLWCTIGALITVFQCHAQQVVINYDHSWRFAVGNYAGSGWFGPGYDDSAWNVGTGVLRTAGETLLQGAPAGMTLSNVTGTTAYFRTTFVLTNASVALTASNQIDDGAVFYLNGQEVGRIAMFAGFVGPTTPATRLDDVITHGVDTLFLGEGLEGTNVLAVEVHQGSFTSSDMVFGTKVIADPALRILRQPQDTSVAPGSTLIIPVSVAGDPRPTFQWRRDGNNLPGQTNAVLVVSNAQSSDAGAYSLLVSQGPTNIVSRICLVEVFCHRAGLVDQFALSEVLSGNGIPISLALTGTPPFAIQWYKGAHPLHGATNQSLAIANAQPSHSGVYRAVIQNCDGTIYSSNFVVSVLDPPVALFGLTNHFWRYNQSGSDLGTGWRAPEYDDSSWPSGRGVFALENSVPVVSLTNTVLSMTSPSGAPIITHYFRTHFSLSNSPDQTVLISSNLFDDGAVIYLNGAEVSRTNMPLGTINATTLALSPLTEGQFLQLELPGDRLRIGDNVLAVEVHQNTSTSSDVVFGMALLWKQRPFVSLAFTEHPADVAVSEGGAASLAARLNGPAAVQWFKDGQLISGATNLTYTIPSAAVSAQGFYSLHASNTVGLASSRLAYVEVVPGADSPRLFSAEAVDATHVLLSFSKPLFPASVTNIGNYTLSNTFGAVYAVSSATLTNATNVLLSTSPLRATNNHIVAVTGLRETSQFQVPVLPGSMAPVTMPVLLVPFEAGWSFLDPVVPIDNPTPPAGWNELLSAPPSWANGYGVFVCGDALVPPDASAGTYLSPSEALTSYFRHDFMLERSRGGLSLVADLVVNDGAALYVNGIEWFRCNLPGQSLTEQTRALTNSGGLLLTNLAFPEHLLKPGWNVIAAELHQTVTSDLNKGFGLRIKGRSDSRAVGPIVVTAGLADSRYTEGDWLELAVQQSGAEYFQWRTNGVNVPGATGAIFRTQASLALNGAAASVVLSNATHSMTSSNAVIQVAPDVWPPEIVSVIASNSSVTIRFSEAVTMESATALSNYEIRDVTGTVVPITAAAWRGSNVILTVSSSFVGGSTLRTSGITDQALGANTIVPNTSSIVGLEQTLTHPGSMWSYDDTGVDRGTAWRNVGYDDSAWRSGPGVFFVGTPGFTDPIGTVLQTEASGGVYVLTCYFRHEFTVPAGVTVQMQIRALIDDGAVFYFNGVELRRIRMQSGPIVWGTQASSSVGVLTTYELPFVHEVTLLHGENVIAVEVHQNGNSSSDIGFAAEVILTSPAVNSARGGFLTVKSWGDQQAIEWPGPPAVLQRAENVGGPWRDLPFEVSPFFFSPTGTSGFYRSRR